MSSEALGWLLFEGFALEALYFVHAIGSRDERF